MEEAFNRMSVSTSESSSSALGLELESRTLRRRRSAASAALLSRPSMLSLGDLTPSFETCVLVYLSSDSHAHTSGVAALRLIYALFEPSFLVDGTSQTVRKLDRPSWERLRSHVEDLRIVALSSRYDEGLTEPPTPTTPCAAPLRKPDCVFDLSMPTDDPTQRIVSQIYLQPASYASVPARCKDELLEIEIHAPSQAEEQRRVCLPAQVRAVLHDAELLMKEGVAPLTPLSAPSMGKASTTGGTGEAAFAETRDRILRLVQDPAPEA
ncbi:hypothetical protein PSEUBRA_005997 [Kalmanozyma brasiliensis GHG001]|uniref:uncharacterized protein n=1 Tax=Kalmanozyma brasiliensis (strain GHG001) TaxID=1365824 RepID=UPI001CEBD8E2|nr:uncharacterized protein PSEUBRA_005997 [Kalmanozyma brasiliensis GHG001]KAF6767593.1 hypothetical protein PSEUBRA_005997 [Kalmanozyma brasiliensis GHG001]